MENMTEIRDLVRRLQRRRAAGKATGRDAISLARDCELRLAEIASEQGERSQPMAEASTLVASEMLNVVIDDINSGADEKTLADALRVLQYIDCMPLLENFARGRYMPQREKIQDLARRNRVDISHAAIDYRPAVDDDAYFGACTTPDDYTRYMHRHPDGKHFDEALAHIAQARSREARRRRLTASMLRIGTAVVALAFAGVLCHVLELSQWCTIGVLMAVAAAMALYIFIKAGSDNPPMRRRYITTAIVTSLVLAVGGGVVIFADSHRRQRQLLDEILVNRDEDALVAYICDPANSYYADEALDAYLAIMDSIFFDPDKMEKPSQMPPLTRMESFSRSEDISEAVRSRLVARMKERTDSLYRIALADGSIEAWEKFQSLAPGTFYYDSSEKIDSLDQVAWNAEPSAWKRASTINTRDAYTQYLDLYPRGAHASTANSRLIDFEVKDYRNQGQIIVDSIDRIADYDGNGSKVCIFNDSGVPITFLFSGPTSGRLSVPPHGNAETEIANGTYQVLAQVSNARRDRFSFTQEFDGGLYSSTISLNEE